MVKKGDRLFGFEEFIMTCHSAFFFNGTVPEGAFLTHYLKLKNTE